jgi:hypothetical protein
VEGEGVVGLGDECAEQTGCGYPPKLEGYSL